MEQTVKMFHAIPNSQGLILPGKHAVYIGAVEYLENGKWTQRYVVDLINDFLDAA